MTADRVAVLLDILRTRLENDLVGLDDDFYAAGGDSLIALNVVADLKERGFQLGLRDLLTSPTVRALVDVLVEIQPSTLSTVEQFGLLTDADRALLPAGVEDAHPASSLQAGLIYLCEMADDPTLYHDMIGMRVRADWDEAAFRTALGQVVARHPALRSSFDFASYSTAMQLVWPSVSLPLQVDLRPDGTEDLADELVAEWRREQLARGIDWEVAPAFRCHVVAVPGAFRLTVAIHHTIIDGWSFARLLVDLLTRYDAALAGTAIEAPMPSTGYPDFVALERSALDSAESAAFWQAEADLPPLLVDRDRFEGAADPSDSRRLPVDNDQLARLRETARRFGVPLKSLLLAVHGWVLARWAERDGDVITGLVVNGRPETTGAEALVGVFLNSVPVRLPGRGDWAELARAAVLAEQRITPHRRFPLASIEHTLGRPAFDVSFNFTHFRVYRELAALRTVGVDSWWSYDKASFPVVVDFTVDGPDVGTGLLVDFDPNIVAADRIDELLGLWKQALDDVGR